MDVSLNLVNVAFCLVFSVSILWDVLKKRRGEGGDNQFLDRVSLSLFTKVTVLLNFVISLSYFGFYLREIWIFETASTQPIFSAVAWFFACILAFFSLTRVPKEWPLVLVIWWGFSATFDSVLVVFFLLHRFEFLEIPKFLPKANVIDFASLPLCVVLCFNAIHNNIAKKTTDFSEPLLETRLENSVENSSDPFSSAGIWSQLTFMWLNPLFKKGHCEKLELEDVPPIPPSESADEASSLLEESLRRRQKNQTTSMPNAISQRNMDPL
ncbi:PREDICTED: ABC transporter C family member 9-like [Erythranthe guttata]|uniref:ABC transporter C family member 9-like n=1 Tax=Erythranthe guttata TaxID=4155 RepID=UPI00064DD32A|nr:PREDICTED: ABC transporter C family member 9-like [Erythranthe guttata]XP_012851241.1 PREDICTED: ABC transporter C family member 9-like [Erythranthe guttata]XP_012851242.1 PREDICTED: ABC transporter C family member 9-like [Erythranthe guttata]|eukprot:XP_012851240.1 PREDICTED: ABC transporter C family member 9-like [Erythranthe guttata]